MHHGGESAGLRLEEQGGEAVCPACPPGVSATQRGSEWGNGGRGHAPRPPEAEGSDTPPGHLLTVRNFRLSPKGPGSEKPNGTPTWSPGAWPAPLEARAPAEQSGRADRTVQGPQPAPLLSLGAQSGCGPEEETQDGVWELLGGSLEVARCDWPNSQHGPSRQASPQVQEARLQEHLSSWVGPSPFFPEPPDPGRLK